MPTVRAAMISLLLSACLGRPGLAQEAEDKMAALKVKETLTDEDRTEIRRWIDVQVNHIVANDPAFAQQAVTDLRTKTDGTRGYREAYVAASLDAIGTAYRNTPPAPAARLLAIAGALSEPRSLNLLLEALKDNRTAVRAAAAIGLRNLRPRLPAEPDAYGRALAALGEAGKKETSREVLQLIYRALNYAELKPAADLKPAAAALLDLLEDRVKRSGAETVPAEAAESVGLNVAGALRPAMDEAARRRYATVLARLLGAAVNRYVAPPSPLNEVRDKTASGEAIALRNGVELIIREAEQQLKELLSPPSPPPNITQKMQDVNATDMVNEMKRWAEFLRQSLGVELTVVEAAAPPERQPPDAGQKTP